MAQQLETEQSAAAGAQAERASLAEALQKAHASFEELRQELSAKERALARSSSSSLFRSPLAGLTRRIVENYHSLVAAGLSHSQQCVLLPPLPPAQTNINCVLADDGCVGLCNCASCAVCGSVFRVLLLTSIPSFHLAAARLLHSAELGWRWNRLLTGVTRIRILPVWFRAEAGTGTGSR